MEIKAWKIEEGVFKGRIIIHNSLEGNFVISGTPKVHAITARHTPFSDYHNIYDGYKSGQISRVELEQVKWIHPHLPKLVKKEIFKRINNG